MRPLASQRGQAAVISVVFLAALLGMAALVLDVGSWYRADRAAQLTADAAALAAAQALPDDPARAEALAHEYADKNGGGVAGVTFGTRLSGVDTVSVRIERSAPGFFARLFGIDSATVAAKATAHAAGLNAAKYAAPIVVNFEHKHMPGGKGCDPTVCDPDFGVETELTLEHLHKPGSGDAAGAFALIDLLGGNGSVGADELASWMAHGFQKNMPLGKYNSVPSVKFNSVQFQDALDLRMGTEVLFPVYKPPIVDGGSTAEYNIIGWVGFVPTKVTGGGSTSKVHGYFTKVIWQGIQVTSGGSPAFGVRGVSLIE